MMQYEQGVTNIILTGFMGSGKTTVGKLLARRLNYDFVDTDALIEAQAQRPIPQIFAELGEAAFRRMEAEAARTLAHRQGVVISTGGRLMLNPENAAVLGQNGRIFCLTATPDEILRRVQKDGHARPLLAGANPGKRIAAILQEREAEYGRFPQVMTGGKTPAQVVDEIAAQLGGSQTDVSHP